MNWDPLGPLFCLVEALLALTGLLTGLLRREG